MDQDGSLQALRGLRTAPVLQPEQALALRSELESALAACSWFTVGVMAPSASSALQALRDLEHSLSWTPLAPNPDAESDLVGGVFLKGNQATGLYAIRAEAGLGEGLLITGHNPEAPEAEGTWGPFPLDFFR